MAQQQSVKSHRVRVRGSASVGLWSCLLNVVLLRSVSLRSVLVRTVLSSALLLSAAADAKTEVAENNQSLSSSAASSQNVNFSQKINLSSGAKGVLEKPSCTAKNDSNANVKGAVLLIHGWAGQKDEVGDLYKDLAHQLSTHCIASVRFDVRGEAEREASNYTLSSTFKSRVEDAQAGLDYLQAQYPSTKLVVVGFSLGGATAMELVSTHPKAFEGLVLWSTALNPNEVVTNTQNFKEVRQALEEGQSTIKSWVDLTLTRKHVVGMLGYNPIRNLGDFEGKMLAIRGANDYLPAHEKVIFEASNAVSEDAYYLGGADHIFNVYEPNKSKKKEVLNLSVNWIKQLFN
ncbi:hypothetical protein ALT761_02527 [Alteromonas sp. 76-1]|uniref:alpha/beta hydrolase n=1 Tax=Alteromonas sp. 76-1 TaxID=2358187 RepID=UPI000FD161ED|nr:alpha/beta fold hydrolase [Alteromonas sp. 76-1]VEL97523.1 hypothetical protein ALT761_02527 [Alteromonas sp. 76-1]